MADNKTFFENLIRVFETSGMPYCVLAGYDDYPELIASDVDFMVPPGWQDRLPGLVAKAAAACGAHLIQSLGHETTATYFVLARREGSRVVYLHPDSSTDYRRGGRLWLRAEAVLAGRRRHAQGFWVPAPADAFAYYLIKKIDKGSLNLRQANELSLRYAEDPAGCCSVLRRMLPDPAAALVEAAARSADWSRIADTLACLREALRAEPAREPPAERLAHLALEMLRRLGRMVRPTGMSIVVLGPDGSGKSAVIARLCQELAPAFRRVEYRHLHPGPSLRRRSEASANPAVVTDPHAKPARGWFGSMAKLLHFWSAYLVGGALWLYPRRVRSTLVLFDRYYHDILADPARYRYGGSLALARWFGRLLPPPDLIFILDAPPEILQMRKQEVPFAESARQRQAYAGIAAQFRRTFVIDAAQPLEMVVARVLEVVIEHLEMRVSARLGLRAEPGEKAAMPWKA